MVLHLDKGEQIDQRTLLRRLAELQYTRNEMEFRRATYRVRGDVIDIFPRSRSGRPCASSCSTMRSKAWPGSILSPASCQGVYRA